jgi:neutral ceramidase
VRATGAALRIAGLAGGDWLIIGVPGEPTAPFASYLRGRSPAGSERTLLIGYTDDYVGYMLTAEDWLSGGYECSTNIWGPREGEQVLEALVDAAAIAWSPDIEDPEAGTSRFDAFAFPPADTVPIGDTTDHGTPIATATLWWPDTIGSVSPQPAAQVPRAVGVARFAWNGGDPGVDFPEVIVEREVAPARFEPVRDALGRAASSARGVIVVTYTPEPLESDAPASHRYAASWQPTAIEPWRLGDPLHAYALPLGRYRLVASGAAVSGRYSLASPPFEVVAAALAAESQATRATSAIDVTALVGPAPGLRALRDGVSDGNVPLLGPWQVTVTFDDATTTALEVMPMDGSGSIALSASDVARAVSVEVRDPAGNGGVLALP